MGQVIETLNSFRTKFFQDSITLPAAGSSVAAGDALSEETTNDHFVFGSSSVPGDFIARPPKVTGAIVSAMLIASANNDTKLEGELWLFHTDIAEIANNAAFTVDDDEIKTLIGVIDFAAADWKVGGGNAMCQGSRAASFEFAIPFPSNGKQIFGQLVARNAYTFANSEELTCVLGVVQD